MIRTAIFAAMMIAAPAFANSVTVNYSDLNLSSAAGQATLEHRINTAARQACGGSPEGSDLTSTTRFYGCVAAARSGAEKSVATAQATPVEFASR